MLCIAQSRVKSVDVQKLAIVADIGRVAFAYNLLGLAQLCVARSLVSKRWGLYTAWVISEMTSVQLRLKRLGKLNAEALAVINGPANAAAAAAAGSGAGGSGGSGGVDGSLGTPLLSPSPVPGAGATSSGGVSTSKRERDAAAAAAAARERAALDAANDTGGENLSSDELAARVDGLRVLTHTLVSAQRLSDPDLIQDCCLVMWNLSLPLLKPTHRLLIERALTTCSEALTRLSSGLYGLRVALHLELAKCHIAHDFLAKASAQLELALSLDYTTPIDVLLSQTQAPPLPPALRELIKQQIDAAAAAAGKPTDSKSSKSISKRAGAVTPTPPPAPAAAPSASADSKNEVKTSEPALAAPSEQQQPRESVSVIRPNTAGSVRTTDPGSGLDFVLRPFDRYLTSAYSALTVRKNLYIEPETVEEQALLCVEQVKDTKATAAKKLLLTRAVSVLERPPLPPAQRFTPEQLQKRAGLWYEIMRLAWSLGLIDVTGTAIKRVLGVCWDPVRDKEFVLQQSTAYLIAGESALAQLKALGFRPTDSVPELPPELVTATATAASLMLSPARGLIVTSGTGAGAAASSTTASPSKRGAAPTPKAGAAAAVIPAPVSAAPIDAASLDTEHENAVSVYLHAQTELSSTQRSIIALYSQLLSSFVHAASLGIALGEDWLVINSVTYLWNIFRPVFMEQEEQSIAAQELTLSTSATATTAAVMAAPPSASLALSLALQTGTGANTNPTANASTAGAASAASGPTGAAASSSDEKKAAPLPPAEAKAKGSSAADGKSDKAGGRKSLAAGSGAGAVVPKQPNLIGRALRDTLLHCHRLLCGLRTRTIPLILSVGTVLVRCLEHDSDIAQCLAICDTILPLASPAQKLRVLPVWTRAYKLANGGRDPPFPADREGKVMVALELLRPSLTTKTATERTALLQFAFRALSLPFGSEAAVPSDDSAGGSTQKRPGSAKVKPSAAGAVSTAGTAKQSIPNALRKGSVGGPPGSSAYANSAQGLASYRSPPSTGRSIASVTNSAVSKPGQKAAATKVAAAALDAFEKEQERAAQLVRANKLKSKLLAQLELDTLLSAQLAMIAAALGNTTIAYHASQWATRPLNIASSATSGSDAAAAVANPNPAFAALPSPLPPPPVRPSAAGGGGGGGHAQTAAAAAAMREYYAAREQAQLASIVITRDEISPTRWRWLSLAECTAGQALLMRIDTNKQGKSAQDQLRRQALSRFEAAAYAATLSSTKRVLVLFAAKQFWNAAVCEVDLPLPLPLHLHLCCVLTRRWMLCGR